MRLLEWRSLPKRERKDVKKWNSRRKHRECDRPIAVLLTNCPYVESTWIWKRQILISFGCKTLSHHLISSSTVFLHSKFVWGSPTVLDTYWAVYPRRYCINYKVYIHTPNLSHDLTHPKLTRAKRLRRSPVRAKGWLRWLGEKQKTLPAQVLHHHTRHPATGGDGAATRTLGSSGVIVRSISLSIM